MELFQQADSLNSGVGADSIALRSSVQVLSQVALAMDPANLNRDKAINR